ncbi:diguanylate cyclase [Zoogloea sp.]|uniref:diguanylate cyclase domain-containing protein n=1 Tax=Zoogloea sp. TaxID=49181 RepID=UPI00261E3B45|nr:diguanylate cyclase [Zoogloea sp.]MDD3352811.1 diguanylate cyclase [Zoogloea sp.]
MSAIVLFIALDLSVLLINLWIAEQVARDAVAINLAGRQRMLSQQTTKSLLLATRPTPGEETSLGRAEAQQAFGLFEQTIVAFADGGATRGGDGAAVQLQAVRGESARIVARTRQLIAPVSAMLGSAAATPGASLEPAARYMVGNNREILDLMNRLTTTLEHDSVSRTRQLRLIQTGAFVLALINFLVIVLGMVRRVHHVEQDRQRWQRLARHDPLTGVTNRKAFEESALGILPRARMDHEGGAILLIDLDGFKQVNDRYGHAAGDEVLVSLADRLMRTARATDVVARLGGDEFAMLCPQLHDRVDVEQFCERLVRACNDLPAPPGCRVGVSVGVATYPDEGFELTRLIELADQAMYAAKRAGGNRHYILCPPPGRA